MKNISKTNFFIKIGVFTKMKDKTFLFRFQMNPQKHLIRSKSAPHLKRNHSYPKFEKLEDPILEVSEGANMFLNAPKNRYYNVLPAKATRVPLKNLKNDYINANFVADSWIATQAPVKKSYRDFWKMIWDNQVSVIVMLTSLEENGVTKASKYWKDAEYKYHSFETLDNTEIIIKIHLDKTIFLRSGKLNVISLSKKGDTEEKTENRTIYHLQYSDWQDHENPSSVEDIDHLINYMELFNSLPNELNGSIVVHCSAGVGRTGTFIACAIVKRLFYEKSKVDIQKIVNSLRQHREKMVQTKEQYRFIFRYFEFLTAIRK